MIGEPFANKDVEKSSVAILKELQKSFPRILAEIIKQLSALAIEDGFIDPTESSDKALTITEKLIPLIKKSGFNRFEDIVLSEMGKLAKSVKTESGFEVSSATKEVIKIILNATHKDIINYESNLSNQLEQVIIKSTLGSGNFQDMIDSIGSVVDRTEDQIITQITGTVSNFHTLVRTTQFKDTEWWLYDGPNDDRTRDFCKHFEGNRIRLEDLDTYANAFKRKHPLPPSVSLGGWNCRHQLIPLSDLTESDYDIIGPNPEGSEGGGEGEE